MAVAVLGRAPPISPSTCTFCPRWLMELQAWKEAGGEEPQQSKMKQIGAGGGGAGEKDRRKTKKLAWKGRVRVGAFLSVCGCLREFPQFYLHTVACLFLCKRTKHSANAFLPPIAFPSASCSFPL